MNETRAVKDLAIGDLIQVEGFEGRMVVRSAEKIKKGLDAGKLHVTLGTPEGETEVMAFDPEERVKVIGKANDTSGNAKGRSKDQGAGKGKGQGKARAKGRTKSKPEPEAETAATPAPEAQEPAAPVPEGGTGAETPKKRGGAKKAGGEKKLSAIDAAAKVLTESGIAMNCQELIKVMAEKGLWTSPGGKTPHSTLYSAILQEINAKGADARFKKTERGKFEAANAKE
jgi:hypothetical protein